MNVLEQARQTINQIDEQMAALFEKRLQASKQVAAYKEEKHLPVFDSEREAMVVESNVRHIQEEEIRPYYKDFLVHLMDISKQYQTVLLGRNKVGYQGTMGAFSQIALQHVFPKRECVAYATFENVFQAVEKGDVTYGVVPFENSYTGEVGEVLDLLYQYQCHINQIVDLKIEQNLLALPGARIQDIVSVYSHHQAISQCAEFLKQYSFDLIPYPNTALAAQFVSQSQDNTKAAIASKETAALYGLEVLVPGINTSHENTTRFIVISKELPGAGNRFSLLFTVDHNAGQLAKVMQTIGNDGFNLENIKSRSLHNQPWQYMFYVEVIGDLQQPKTKALLDKLKECCLELKVLGGYTV